MTAVIISVLGSLLVVLIGYCTVSYKRRRKDEIGGMPISI